jgi:hypothetical protein
MGLGPIRWIGNTITRWLTEEQGPTTTPLCDFERIRYEVRPGDVLLIEGRTRISEVIKTITQSPWSHSALYLGRIHDIDDPDLRERIRKAHPGDAEKQLVIEALLGEGTVVNDLGKYRDYHIRICRPSGLARSDAQKVIAYCLNHLGFRYDVRQLLDMARFLLPYNILPRRWRSSLFEHNAGASTRTVCSSMLAAAFNSVQFPVLPVIHRREDGSMRVYPRNARLYTPRDFDYSPYFEIIKYPFLGIDERTRYRNLPWDHKGHILEEIGRAPIPGMDEIEEHQGSDEATGDQASQTTRAV